MEKFAIRQAKSEDCSQIAQLILELARYEHLEDKVLIGEKEIREDGFGKRKLFSSFVAEMDHPTKGPRIVGYCMYFYTYSTFEGRSIYMEDLFVKPEYRSRGIGKALIKNVAKVAYEFGCKRLDFAVLSWNTPTIGFYKSFGAENITEKNQWHLFRINEEEIKKMAS